MRTALFTIIAPNRRHYARLLMASAARHEPAWDRFVLLVAPSATEADGDPGVTTVALDALPLPRRRPFTFRYTILELSTAVKPWMFAHLFGRGYDRVVYLDPDIVMFSPLAELDAAAADTLLLLTPHLTGSIEGDDHPSERAMLQAGAFNLGFLAAWRQPGLDAFLAWWQARLEEQCLHEVERGLFVDQKWMDLAPGLFPGVAILRHDGWNVAYWNLRQRTVRREPGGALSVNGVALRFFHFSGVEPTVPGLVSKHDGRLTLDEVGDARPLIEDYREALRREGQEGFERAPYAFGAFADGTPIAGAARAAYRRDPELQRACGDDPFAHPERFRGLRDRVRAPAAARIALRSYHLLSKPRRLVGLVPRPMRTAMRELLIGAPGQSAARSGPGRPRPAGALPPGLTIVGFHGRDTGVGESARLCRRACERVGLMNQAVDLDVRTPGAGALMTYEAAIFHVNADRTADACRHVPAILASGARTIACWHWELAEWPEAWAALAAPFDEIWAPSAFIQGGLSRLVSIPVVHMPHGVEVTDVEPCAPQAFGVPPGHLTFLAVIDVDSVVARKNPEGAAAAFARAFPVPSAAALLVKLRGGEPAAREALAARLRATPGVHVTDAALSRAQVNGLLAASDAIVSLHRGEGFGLVLAEAMALGKPVVATGWSGNMDFMDEGNACPVRYELVPIGRDYGHYRAQATWAEPDVEHAAHLMRRLAADAAWRAELGARARETIRARFSPEAAGRRYQARLARLA